MNIGVTLRTGAYTPEAYAYKKFLSKKGWNVQLDYELDPDNDINIYFMGIRPVWRRYNGKAIEIHEYQSLSTPPYARIKNSLKKLTNIKPNGRIFLNEIVSKDLDFNDNIPFIYRDMGIYKGFFQEVKPNPEYDIIYSGSIDRKGVPEIILNLANKYKILVVGAVNNTINSILKRSNITLVGKLNYYELPELYAKARYGLNYTPDVYPFNIQTSTKTLEYLASGLGVISNRYIWIESFINQVNTINQQVIWLDDFLADKNKELFFREGVSTIDMSAFSWESILMNSGLEDFLHYAIQNS